MADRPSSFAADLSALLRSMPDRSATSAERADWFDRKAALFDQVAASGDAEAAELARSARETANSLRRGVS